MPTAVGWCEQKFDIVHKEYWSSTVNAFYVYMCFPPAREDGRNTS